ncbi:MAG: SDR family oxidoreductase [Hyphomicrobiales bacterium]|nr:SDR family oxidoreductase [Hyphomicrobiales bacterium]
MHTLITGAASGIGKATALRLAKRSAITIADRNEEGARAVAKDIIGSGGKAQALVCDVSDVAAIETMVKEAEKGLGPIDALFNNAGINLREPVLEISGEHWDTIMNVHVRGMFFVAQNVLRGMVERKAGVIVNTSSDFAVIGVPNLGSYCAAKTAIYSLTKCLALEFASHGIRINAIGPGPIDTPILRQNRKPDEIEMALAANAVRTPLGRLGKPEEVAATVDFLLSDRSSYINGQLIQPNGGCVIW